MTDSCSHLVAHWVLPSTNNRGFFSPPSFRGVLHAIFRLPRGFFPGFLTPWSPPMSSHLLVLKPTRPAYSPVLFFLRLPDIAVSPTVQKGAARPNSTSSRLKETRWRIQSDRAPAEFLPLFTMVLFLFFPGTRFISFRNISRLNTKSVAPFSETGPLSNPFFPRQS